MASEADGPQEAEQAARIVEIDMEWVPSLPGGRSVFPAEQQDRLIWLVAEGSSAQQCFDEMREYLRYMGREGLLTQRWDGKPPLGFDGAPSAPK